MSDKFERHRSTRWVQADVPVYGDEWGNEYDQYAYEDEDEDVNHPGPAEPPQSYSPEPHHDLPIIPVSHPTDSVSNSTLVLSPEQPNSSPKFTKASKVVGTGPKGTKLSNDENRFHNDAGEQKKSTTTDLRSHFSASQSKPRGSVSLEEASEPGVSNASIAGGADLLPPTPTYQTKHEIIPGSPESGRSYLSDADSIQREPDMLNVKAPGDRFAGVSSFNARVEEAPPKSHSRSPSHAPSHSPTHAPDHVSVPAPAPAPAPAPVASLTPVPAVESSRMSEDLSSASMSTGERSFFEPPRPHEGPDAPEALILSIDGLNLDDSDDSSFDDYRSHSHLEKELSGDDEMQNSNDSSPLNRYNDSSDGSGKDDDDDWGYNSEHSSNFENPDPTTASLETPLHKTISNHVPRHRVKTDALDSLINDLSKMEGDTSLFDDPNAQNLRPGQQDFTDSGKSEYHTTRDGKGILPTLDSIHDIKLPNFEDHSFNDGDDSTTNPSIPRLQSSSTLDEDHQRFVSSVRRHSIRKPPPLYLAQRTDPVVKEHPLKNCDSTDLSPDLPTKDSNEGTEDTPHKKRHIKDDSINDASFEKSIISDLQTLPPPPISKDSSEVNRRVSTMSTSTFNLGSWKPNTGMYRDKFVNDNDNESQMNVSIFNKDDSAYKKFTRMGPSSNYAPSIANSSCISVPDTVDTNLQQIDEDSDDDYPDAVSVAKSYHPMSPQGSSENSIGSSILHEHVYGKAKFHELSQTPTTGSTDELAPINEEGEPKSTKAGTIASSETLTTLSAKSKYPVSNWKNIMATSQPIDRIELFKKARTDEINYDTGLSQWLRESLKSTDSPNIQIGQLATQAYKNAQHSDVRRHTSIRSKVNLVRDKMETGNLGIQASNLGRKFFSRGKKLMKQSSD
ncbi:hypothetical protein JCM33374_g4829 [Metschnikowia sp. JCM 33374]|nr:hypothetical protein JCM33374_g4829 [Metschnikowia sp. JCM 33374]